jgi:hypothetical protein
MPTPSAILDSLTRIANEAIALAITWHLVLAVVIVLLLASWRPMQRTARVLIAVPLLSVAALAAAFGNPFTALVLGAGAFALIAIGVTARSAPVARAGPLASLAGSAAIAFGWFYPHFLDGGWVRYLYASPFGLVPCPTLAVACGFALLGGGLGSRAWTFTLAALGLFYGGFGVLRLGVYLDVPLIAVAAALAAQGLHATRRTPAAPSVDLARTPPMLTQGRGRP